MTHIIITMIKREISLIIGNPRLIFLPLLTLITSLFLILFFAPDLALVPTKTIYFTLLFLTIASQDNSFANDNKTGFLDHLTVHQVSKQPYLLSKLAVTSLIWIMVSTVCSTCLWPPLEGIDIYKLALFVFNTNILVLMIHRLCLSARPLSALMVIMAVPFVLPIFMMALYKEQPEIHNISIGFAFYTVCLFLIYSHFKKIPLTP